MPDDPEVKVLQAAGVGFAGGAEGLSWSALDDAEADAERLAAVIRWFAGSRGGWLACNFCHHRFDNHAADCAAIAALAAHEARRKGRTP